MTRTEWQKVRDQMGFKESPPRGDVRVLDNGWYVVADSREAQMIFNVFDPTGNQIVEFNDPDYAMARAEKGNENLRS